MTRFSKPCPFCSRSTERIVLDGRAAFARWDSDPLNPGAVWVVPRRKPASWSGATSWFVLRIAFLGLLASGACFAAATSGAGAEPREPPSIEVTVEQGRLTVDVRDAPLDDVLHAVGDEEGIAIAIHGDLTEPVTNSFADVPLDEAIRRLLRGHSYTISGDAEGSRQLEISVLPSHRTEAPATAASMAVPNDLRDKLQRIRALAVRKDAAAIAELSGLAGGDPSPMVRAQAIAALGRLRTQEAAAPLTLALTDESAVVRIQAMRGVKNLKGAAAIDDLRTIAGSDPDPAVRRQAVRLIADIPNPEVPWLLEQAAADGDAAVSQEAKRAAAKWGQRNGVQHGAAGGIR